MRYIRWFDEIGAADITSVGGKGANLGELTKAGLPVPPGFCLTSAAYKDFVHLNSIDRIIEDNLKDLHLGDLDDVRRRSAQIQQAILSAQIAGEISGQIVAGAQALFDRTSHQVSLAVRSSATAEDQANASFAGQLETFLNIRGEAALLAHVKQCWASLWAERVLTYLANQGLDYRVVSMSVIVQAMIPSEVSGVLFTANPVTGKRDEVVINASWGLGEAIVSGVVSPDTITARKDDGGVIERQTADKELMIVYAADGGTEELPVAEDLRAVPALTDQQVGELALLGRQIEAYYGKPQDIEWGLYNGQWYLLQSRPVTTLALQPEYDYPPGEFNRTMFIEIFPDPLSPVFMSVIAPLFKEMLDFTFQSLGFEPRKDIPAIGSFYNQPYFNRDYIAAAFQPLSPAVREPLVAQMVNPFGAQEEATSLEFSLPFLRMMSRILRFMVRFPRQLPRMLATYRSQIAQVEAFPYEIAGDEEICEEIRRLPFEYANKLLNNDFLMIAVIGRTYRLLGAVLRRFYQAETDEVVAKLISGVTGNVTMETNKRLWDLAQIARSSSRVRSVIEANAYPQAVDCLKEFPEGKGFLQALERFLGEYGHREVRMDILVPTWCDDPEPVLGFIRSYMDADESQSPYSQQERLVRERERLTRMVLHDVEKSLSGRLLLSPVFKWILGQTQIHTRERDTMHFEMTRLFPPIRQLMLELGRRWSEKKLIAQEDDIFFLSIEEMFELARSPRAIHELVDSRRQNFLYAQRHAPPSIIRDGEEIFSAAPEAALGETSSLKGIAGSPGQATGAARVIRGPAEFSKLMKGEILVAPITNPVWTPLFAIAGAVVTEVGGILSHGAIVAREYGIPAVMSVHGATRLLRDGQRVLVDGNKGIVRLEMEA